MSFVIKRSDVLSSRNKLACNESKTLKVLNDIAIHNQDEVLKSYRTDFDFTIVCQCRIMRADQILAGCVLRRGSGLFNTD